MPAPSTSAAVPLKERLLALAQTLQFAWFMGHMTLIACSFRYSLSLLRFNYYGRMAQFSYRLLFFAAALTYGIVVYKSWRSRARLGSKAPNSAVGILGDENVQYLGMTLVWLVSPQYPLAFMPYAIYSVFHVLSYTRSTLIPIVQPPQLVSDASKTDPNSKPQYAPNPTAEAIRAFVHKYYEFSMSIVSSLEILIWLRLILAAVFFARRSWILFGIYTIFLRARYAQSAHVRDSFSKLEAYLDRAVANPGLPPVVRQVWETVKTSARSFHDVTDVNQFLSGSAAPKKTS